MCAIAGIIGLNASDTTVREMIETMTPRGPDAKGYFKREACCLLHTRLAVIDPEGGHQPMHLQMGNEEYILVYNGELYNTHEIRSELLRLGHNFKDSSDTEVVLHAFAQWGEDCVCRFNGIFAFAVWDAGNKRLFLARDKMGVKPLFYKCHQGGMLFASELKTILAYPTVEAQIDADGVGEILLLGPGRTPGSGVFRGIMELEPGCCGWFKEGKWTCHRYWKLKDREHRESFEETAEHVRFLVTDAIRRQTVSDVPIGTFLSGGLDSSLISAVCAAEAAEKGERLPTFSLDYDKNDQYFTPGKFQPNADTSYISVMQEHLGTDHHWTVLTPEDLTGALEASTRARDLPGMADVDFSLLVFCGNIRKYVKVALSGECADEIFGGYPWYRDPDVRDRAGFPWAQNTAYRASFLSPYFAEKLKPESFVNDRYLQTVQNSDILPGTAPAERRMKEMVNLNQYWFMQTLLDRKDRMSMYHGLEVRVPFCDYRIAEYLYGVPWEYKDYQGMEKGLLRHAMASWLPPQVLYRKKSPYPKTYDPHYLELVGDLFRQMLQNPAEPIFQLVKKEALQSLLEAEYPWPWYGQLMRLPQTIAYILQINCWLKMYRVSVV